MDDSSKQPLRASNLENSPRRKRQLPEPVCDAAGGGGGGGGGMRRTQSLSFLPGSAAQGARRRLPDPGQGRLIQHIATKLKEESLVRLKVAKELKGEKRLRWRTEDELAAAQQEVSRLNKVLSKKTTEADSLQRDAEEAQRNYVAVSDRLAELERKQRAVNAAKERLEAERFHHQEQEATLEMTLDELEEQRRENVRLRHDFDALISAMDDFQPGASRALLERVQLQSTHLLAATSSQPATPSPPSSSPSAPAHASVPQPASSVARADV